MVEARLPAVGAVYRHVGHDRLLAGVDYGHVERRALLRLVRGAYLDRLDGYLEHEALRRRLCRRAVGVRDGQPAHDQARDCYCQQSAHVHAYRLPDLTNSAASPTITATITAMPMNPKELDCTAVMRNCSSSDSAPTTVSSLRL